MIDDQKGILLDSGTNEMEVLIFRVGKNRYGINVLKVREIIKPIEVSEVPQSHDHIEGAITIRDEVVPLIDLSTVLELNVPEDSRGDAKFIITEFNKMKFAFRVCGDPRIHRVSWDRIEKPNNLYKREQNNVNGVIQLDGKGIVMLLDYEKIVTKINKEVGLETKPVNTDGSEKRNKKSIYIAEDSTMLMEMLKKALSNSGYTDLFTFQDGSQAWDKLSELDERDYPDAVITDIEMPSMDGHTLTRKIKEDPNLQDIPVLIFSSLITEGLIHKGDSVGADGQISKPEVIELITKLDRLTEAIEQNAKNVKKGGGSNE